MNDFSEPRYKDCKDAHDNGQTESGVFTIYPAGNPISASCDMETEGGGWTVSRYNTEHRNQQCINGNVHAHMPFIFDCRDVIIICRPLWSEEKPNMTFLCKFSFDFSI